MTDHVNTSWDRLRLRYDAPARGWTDALPLGDGRLGVMAFGGIELDRLQINDERCWSGVPHPSGTAEVRPGLDGPAVIAGARTALSVGDPAAASDLLQTLQHGHSQAYQPLADLWLEQASAPASERPGSGHRGVDAAVLQSWARPRPRHRLAPCGGMRGAGARSRLSALTSALSWCTASRRTRTGHLVGCSALCASG